MGKEMQLALGEKTADRTPARASLTERLRERFYRWEDHPYRIFERKVLEHLEPDATLLDAGCGRTAEVLLRFKDKAGRLIGVDLVQFDEKIANSGALLLNENLGAIPLPDRTADLVISRSVMEHLEDPLSVYKEFARVLKPGGHLVFLTANLWDYGTLFSRLIPNKFHARIVAKVEGRQEEDTFPTRYRTNTARSVKRFARSSGLEVKSLEHLNQYPCYFLFNPVLFLAGTLYERITSRFRALRFLRGWLLVVLEKPRVDAVIPSRH